MTTLREAAQQALEALTAHADLHSTMYLKMDAIAALKAALAEPVQEPVQEPVAWEQFHEHMTGPFYRAPPQRKPLTDEEIQELSQQHKFDSRMEKFVRIIERAHGIGGNDE